jgi:hypothetical protein
MPVFTIQVFWGPILRIVEPNGGGKCSKNPGIYNLYLENVLF